jgi:predicted nucleic acid-binding protein
VITLILDASVAIELFARDHVADLGLRHRVLTGRAAAPELIDLEVCNVMRRLVRQGVLQPGEATEAVRDVRDAPVLRVGHRQLIDRAWELRDNLSPYDASYIALAELFDVPLVTCDARLGRAVDHGPLVEVYPRS